MTNACWWRGAAGVLVLGLGACAPAGTGETSSVEASSSGGEQTTTAVDPMTTSGGIFTLTSVTEGDPTSEGTATTTTGDETTTVAPGSTSTGEVDPCPGLIAGLAPALTAAARCELALRIDGAGAILGWASTCVDQPAMTYDDKSAFEATQCCSENSALLSPDGQSPWVYHRVPMDPELGGVAVISNHIGAVVYDATIGVAGSGTISVPPDWQDPSALGDGAGCSGSFDLGAQTYDLILGGPLGDPDVDLLTTAIEATALPTAIEQAATVDGVLALGYEAEYMKPGTTFVVLIELLSSR